MNARIKTILANRRKTALNRAALDNERAKNTEELHSVTCAIRKAEYNMVFENIPLNAEYDRLTAERDRLIKKHNLVLEPPFFCAACSDTGYLADGSMCSCLRALVVEDFKRALNIDNNTAATFAATDFTVFGDKCAEYEKLYGKMQKFCEKFDTTKILTVVLTGAVGTGKTYLTACVLNELLARNRSALFLTAFEFGTACMSNHTDFSSSDILNAMLDADFLVIDDLGTEPIYRNVTIEYLYSVLNERQRRNKKTMITTNLPLGGLLERYGERVHSRLNNKLIGVTLQLQGADLRRNGK